MSKRSIQVENVKCGGCAANIEKALGALAGIDQVSVDVQSGTVSLEGDADQSQVLEALKNAGYPAKAGASGNS